jgi:hypothetical protein
MAEEVEDVVWVMECREARGLWGRCSWRESFVEAWRRGTRRRGTSAAAIGTVQDGVE